MRDLKAPHRTFFQAGLILGALAALSGLSPAFGQDKEVLFQQRRKKAQSALEERMKARFAAGWTPKSKDEQMVTRLSALQRMWERKQDRANTRSAFEAARAEVYMRLVRHYTSYGYYRRGYVYTYVQDRVTGAIRPVVRARDYWVLDPWAARLSAHFGNKAARSKGIAAAQEYHANTYFERQVRNTSQRIAVLQKQISLQAQLAAKVQ